MRIQLVTYNALGLAMPTSPEQAKAMKDNVMTLLKVDPYGKLQTIQNGLPNGCFSPDIVVVCLQEMVGLTVPGFLTNNTRVAESWSRIITDVLNTKISPSDPVYVAREPITMFGLALFIFVRQELNSYISSYERDNVKTGGIGPVCTSDKGGIATSMNVGQTTMCFVGCHLESGAANVNNRRDDYSRIVKNMSFGDDNKKIGDHEYVFWLGDMNSHLNIDTPEAAKTVQTAMKNADWQYLVNTHDQLTADRRRTPANGGPGFFYGYKEGLITFPPTHTFVVGTHKYIANSPPHWSDRILWTRNGKQTGSGFGNLLLYDSVQSIVASDHRPVEAILDINVSAPSLCVPNSSQFSGPIPIPVPSTQPAQPTQPLMMTPATNTPTTSRPIFMTPATNPVSAQYGSGPLLMAPATNPVPAQYGSGPLLMAPATNPVSAPNGSRPVLMAPANNPAFAPNGSRPILMASANNPASAETGSRPILMAPAANQTYQPAVSSMMMAPESNQRLIYPTLPEQPSYDAFNTSQMMAAVNQIPEREYIRPQCGCANSSSAQCSCRVGVQTGTQGYVGRVHLQAEQLQPQREYIQAEPQIVLMQPQPVQHRSQPMLLPYQTAQMQPVYPTRQPVQYPSQDFKIPNEMVQYLVPEPVQLEYDPPQPVEIEYESPEIQQMYYIYQDETNASSDPSGYRLLVADAQGSVPEVYDYDDDVDDDDDDDDESTISEPMPLPKSNKPTKSQVVIFDSRVARPPEPKAMLNPKQYSAPPNFHRRPPPCLPVVDKPTEEFYVPMYMAGDYDLGESYPEYYIEGEYPGTAYSQVMYLTG